MSHDVNFNELTSPTEMMDGADMVRCIDNLRDIIAEGKAQWDKLAAVMHVNGDDPDAVFATARTLMAGMGGETDGADVQRARETFPAFAELHKCLDIAILHETELFNRHCDELAAMSVDSFIEFKRQSAKSAVGKLQGARRWWHAAPDAGGLVARLKRALFGWRP